MYKYKHANMQTNTFMHIYIKIRKKFENWTNKYE